MQETNKPKNLSLAALVSRNDDILKEFFEISSRFEREKTSSDIYGTSIPFIYSRIGSWLVNPSTVSIDTFQKMAYSDPVITSALEYNSSVISNTIGQFHHKNPEIQAFIRECFERLDGGGDQLVKNMMTSQWAGFFVGEKIYSKYSEFIDDKIWIKEVLPLPSSTIVFRAEESGKLMGEIYQYVFYAAAPGIQNMLSSWAGGLEFGYAGSNSPDAMSYEGDFPFPARAPNAQRVGLYPIPRQKIIHYARKGQDALTNPYGRSMLRAAYNFYILKVAMLQFLAVAAKLKSYPLLVGYVDPSALSADADVSSINNQDVNDYRNRARNAVDAVAAALDATRGDNAIVLPFMKNVGCVIDAVHSEGNTDLLLNIMNFLDDQLQKSLFFPSSMLGGGAGASYAMGTSQNTIQSKLLSSDRSAIAKCLIREYVKDIVEKNYTEEQHKNNFGWFESELLNTEDKINIMKLYEIMVSTGMTSNFLKLDVDRFRQRIGEPPLTDEEFEILKKFAEQNKIKDNTGKTNVKEADTHYKHQTEVPFGGSSV